MNFLTSFTRKMWLAAGWLFLWTLLSAQAVSAKENPLWLRYPALEAEADRAAA